MTCDIFMTTMSRVDFVGGNSDVLDLFFITIVFYNFFFFFFLLNAVHKFPVYGTIKCYCIVLYCLDIMP